MSTTASYRLDNKSASIDLYELKTLPRGSILNTGRLTDPPWDENHNKDRMAVNTKREKKVSLTFKERLFGPKKNRKGRHHMDYNIMIKFYFMRVI